MSEEISVVDGVLGEVLPEQTVTLAELLEAPATREYTVPLSALGKGKVAVIRNLTHREVREVYDRCTDKKGKVDMDQVEQMMVQWASVNPKIMPDAYRQLVGKNAALIRQYVGAILEVSGCSADSLEAARARFRE